MLSKEKFVKAIQHIKEHQELEMNLSKSLEAMSDDCYCSTFVYTRYEDLVIDLLKEALGLDENIDWIEYFIYELDFGAKFKPDSVIEVDGTAIDFSTAEALYDYLKGTYLCK